MMIMMMMMMMMMALKHAIPVFLQPRRVRTLSVMDAEVAIAQSCPNHVQHTRCLSLATRHGRVQRDRFALFRFLHGHDSANISTNYVSLRTVRYKGTPRLLSLTQSVKSHPFLFISLAETVEQ